MCPNYPCQQCFKPEFISGAADDFIKWSGDGTEKLVLYHCRQFKETVLARLEARKAARVLAEANNNDRLGVTVENGKVIVSSLDVAKVFERRHDNVLRDIETLDCSHEFRLLNFEESSYNNVQNKPQPCYKMTRDGFTFLCMGYTGKKAAEFNEAYIMRFNKMEETLIKLDYNAALTSFSQKALPESPESQKIYTPNEAAKALMLHGLHEFYALMIDEQLLIKVNGTYRAKPECVEQGLFGFFRNPDIPAARELPSVTQKGIEYLWEALKNAAVPNADSAESEFCQ